MCAGIDFCNTTLNTVGEIRTPGHARWRGKGRGRACFLRTAATRAHGWRHSTDLLAPRDMLDTTSSFSAEYSTTMHETASAGAVRLSTGDFFGDSGRGLGGDPLLPSRGGTETLSAMLMWSTGSIESPAYGKCSPAGCSCARSDLRGDCPSVAGRAVLGLKETLW